MNDLKRFLDAQENDFERALAEIKRGRKQSHWIWYIFPQIKGLGSSETYRFYAVKGTVHDLDHVAQISRVMAKQYKEEVGPWIDYLRILNL